MSEVKTKLRGALIGTLLGDSYIYKCKNAESYKFGCEQINQSLIELKYNIIKEYCKDNKRKKFGKISTRTRKPAIVHNGKKISIFKPSYSFNIGNPYFKHLHKIFYRTGTKQVTINTLKWLTLEGIAFWYMDDGYIRYTPSNSTRYLEFSTDSFSEYSHKQIQLYFKQYHQLDCKIIIHNSGNGAKDKFRIRFNSKNAQKLIVKIYPYIIKDFMYKLNLHYKPRFYNNLDMDYLSIVKKEFDLQTSNSTAEDIV